VLGIRRGYTLIVKNRINYKLENLMSMNECQRSQVKKRWASKLAVGHLIEIEI
jgi:hypothetical protein